MNRGYRNLALPIALAALVFAASGCKKKTPAVPPPQAEAPTIELPAPSAPPATGPSTTTAPPTETTTTESPAPTLPPKPQKPKSRVGKKPSAGVPAATNTSTPPATVAADGSTNGSTSAPPVITTPSGKVIVPEGSVPAPAGQISTTMPSDKEAETRLNTERSLQGTEKNLKAITWAPSLDQKTMIDQIKTYIAQSRSANTEGDVVRASNLAQKAQLLCDELLKK